MAARWTSSSEDYSRHVHRPLRRPGLAMDYFDGNTVTGMWNYAQNYS